jgi:hypothetical protein
MILRRVVLTLLAALFILALPAVASAADYEVDSTANEEDAAPGVGGCVTLGLKCTLRAAIEESNASTGVRDEITFSAAFDGDKADSTIDVPSSLPQIQDPVTIDGGLCETDANVKGPCVGVNGESRFEVRAPEVQIDGLAISEFQIAIAVEADEFGARGDWIGFQLDGTGSGEQPLGIFVAPHADGAVIGGTEPAERNVIGNTNSGVILRGASFGTVLGNYFGVEPDGTTPASNGRDLVVADKKELLASVAATDNQIGADVGASDAETSECDLGCNVFASRGGFGYVAAIDLQGNEVEEELPATGPTLIEGNYIGLDAHGEAFTEAAESGIRVGSAGSVTIGGPEPGQANQIHGGTYGVFAGEAGPTPALDLVVEGNRIGRSLDGTAALYPPSIGISASSEGITEAADNAVFVNNSIGAAQVGIKNHSTGAVIAGNAITGGGTAIHVLGDTEASGIGNLLEGNKIAGTSGAGILIENDFNEVLGNKIFAAGGSGIAIQPYLALGADGNLIGGDVPGSENTILGSGDDAIRILDFEGTFTEVARNLGAGNDGRFIRLIAAGGESVGPNGGIEPPEITTAGKTEASGSAEPLALVRVFRKDSTEPGELGAFLGEATADGSGNWSATYAALPGSTLVTATQTNTEGGTSELADPVATPADPKPPPPSGGETGSGNNNAPIQGCLASSGSCGPPIGRRPPPDTKIVKGPSKKTHKTTVAFRFKSTVGKSTFQCKMDRKPFKPCSSPKKYKKLKPGKHVFQVRAIDNAGNVDPTPAKRKFTVLR